VKRRWLLLGLLGAAFGGAPPDPVPVEPPAAEEASGARGHRAEGPRFYVWQEEAEETASWAAALRPLERPPRSRR
jgi:hypothetical protein